MKNYLLPVIFAVFPFLLTAQNVKEAFLSMPSSLFTEISIDNRMDMIDIYEAGAQSVVVQNKLKDTIHIENLTEDFLLVNSGNSSIQLIVLQQEKQSPIYCLIHTVCAPACDSRLTFYSASWEKLETAALISPVSQDWFVDNSKEFPELCISLMQFQYDPEEKVLKQTNNSPEYLPVEEQEKIKPYLKATVKKYKWNGKRFSS